MLYALGSDGDGLVDLELVARLCDGSPLGIVLSDELDRSVYTNVAYRDITGLTADQALGTTWDRRLHAEDRDRVVAEWQAAAQDGRPFQAEARLVRPGGDAIWTRLHIATMPDGGRPTANLLMVEEISERRAAEEVLRAAEEALFAEKERAQVTLDSIGDAVLATDLAGHVTYMNLEAQALTGWSRREALGRPLVEVFRILDGVSREVAPNPAERAMAHDCTVGLATGCVLVRRDGSEVGIEDSAAPIHNRDGTVAGAVIVFHDVAQSRAMAERMAHLARHDSLTGLANSALLTERLTLAISQAQQHGTKIALLFIDLDDFKGINDSYGHLVGDQLLQSVAARLANCVRTADTVSRRGGDEFVILLTEIRGQKDAARVAEKVLASIAAPHRLEGIELRVRASIGVSLFPDDSADLVDLVRNADTAMYHVKASGADAYRFFGGGNTMAQRRVVTRGGGGPKRLG
jgi:diguanylate cyclase (GGDEF)-like protein/PAS domain S-box-containing protein